MISTKCDGVIEVKLEMAASLSTLIKEVSQRFKKDAANDVVVENNVIVFRAPDWLERHGHSAFFRQSPFFADGQVQFSEMPGAVRLHYSFRDSNSLLPWLGSTLVSILLALLAVFRDLFLLWFVVPFIGAPILMTKTNRKRFEDYLSLTVRRAHIDLARRTLETMQMREEQKSKTADP